MANELLKELNKRGTAEISNGIINQVMQAISEASNEVEFLCFGELIKKKIKPIEECCPKCGRYKDSFFEGDMKACQQLQKGDSEARGFANLICPHQFEE